MAWWGWALGVFLCSTSCAASASLRLSRMRPFAERLLGTLRTEVGGLDDQRRRMALANELLMDIDNALVKNQEVPKQLAWIAMLAGLGASAGTLLLGGADRGVGVLVCLLGGALGASACVAIGRLMATQVDEVREMVDNSVEAMVGDLYDAAIMLPSRRRMRWHRASR